MIYCANISADLSSEVVLLSHLSIHIIHTRIFSWCQFFVYFELTIFCEKHTHIWTDTRSMTIISFAIFLHFTSCRTLGFGFKIILMMKLVSDYFDRSVRKVPTVWIIVSQWIQSRNLNPLGLNFKSILKWFCCIIDICWYGDIKQEIFI